MFKAQLVRTESVTSLLARIGLAPAVQARHRIGPLVSGSLGIPDDHGSGCFTTGTRDRVGDGFVFLPQRLALHGLLQCRTQDLRQMESIPVCG